MPEASRLRILFVEDQPDDIELETRQLVRDGLEFDRRAAASEMELRAALEEFQPNVVLCDYSIPGFSGREALRVVRQMCPETPFIFVSGTIGEETAVECLREGAIDYVLKSNPRRLGPAVRRALREVEERKSYEAHIRHLANYDGLTDLPNRALLADRVGQAIINARRAKRGFTLLTLNIDGLRLVNEGFGHAAGDGAIRAVGERLRSSAREGDTVARTGNDEFTVLLPDIERPDEVHGYASRIREAIRVPYSVANTELRITASAGAAIFPIDGGDFETLLRNAATAVRAAKVAGRDALQFCSADAMNNALERILIETGLSQALQRGAFHVHYQAQQELDGGRVCGFEALVRWQRNGTALVSPANFIPVAEETGLIHAIGEHVLEVACHTALPWVRRFANRLTLGVNVSPHQLRDPRFVGVVARVLGATGFPVECLELEMTESALMSDSGALDAIARLRGLGVKIAIDDFGTGYSSLSYLSRLPVDRLKIDSSFVGRMTADPRDLAIVQSIIALGHGLKMKVIAEGVETREQRDTLLAMGCDQAQGYFFAQPVDAGRIRERFDST